MFTGKRTSDLIQYFKFEKNRKASFFHCMAYTKNYRCSWKDNVKVDLTGCKGVGWIYLTQDLVRWWALVNKVMNPSVP
jgi:hypothetical protein